MKMKIALLLGFSEEWRMSLQDRLPGHEVVMAKPTDKEDAKAAVRDAKVIVGPDINAEILAEANQLELIQVPWAGVERIDFELLQGTGIRVCNSNWNNLVVAEFAIALLLSVAKRLGEGDRGLREGIWHRSLRSKQLHGSTMLIIGFGSIGKHLARLLAPFGMRIVALCRNPEKTSEEHRQLVDKIISWDDFESEAKHADFAICSLPLTPATKGILDAEKLAQLKQGCVFVNVGRGATTDEDALFEALETGHLAGAGLDVWYKYNRLRLPEPFFPSDQPFQDLDNVIMSPHRAATFEDKPDARWDDTVFNIQAIEEGKPLRNGVSLEHQY